MSVNDEKLKVVINELAEDNQIELKKAEQNNFNDEWEQLYDENKEAFDFLGGIDMLEAILEISDENFEELQTHFLAIFTNLLNDSNVEIELKNIIFSQNYTLNDIEEEFNKAMNAIEEVEIFSDLKKDFLKNIFIIVTNKIKNIINNLNKSIYIPCELEENVKLPVYAHETDAGLDIYAREEITIGPGETKILSTGIKTAIPEGYAILIQPRSGQSVKTKLRIANTPGLIDSGYRDDIGVIIENIEPPFKDIDYEFDDNGEIHIKSIVHGLAYTIAEGQRFAQMRLVQVPKAEFIQVESVGEIGEDRGGGFGSSGK